MQLQISEFENGHILPVCGHCKMSPLRSISEEISEPISESIAGPKGRQYLMQILMSLQKRKLMPMQKQISSVNSKCQYDDMMIYYANIKDPYPLPISYASANDTCRHRMPLSIANVVCQCQYQMQISRSIRYEC